MNNLVIQLDLQLSAVLKMFSIRLTALEVLFIKSFIPICITPVLNLPYLGLGPMYHGRLFDVAQGRYLKQTFQF